VKRDPVILIVVALVISIMLVFGISKARHSAGPQGAGKLQGQLAPDQMRQTHSRLRAGVPVTVVPGVTSAVGVPASAWVPVTHRGVAQDFHVVSVHVPPGDERSTVNWELLAGISGTLVLLMAVERIGAVANELLRYGRSPDTPVSVIADGTLPTQRTINSTLEQVESLVAKEGIRPPAIAVVGDVVAIAAEITELMRDVTA